MYDDIMAEYESPSNNNMDFVCLSYDELIATCNNTTITNPNSVDMNTLIERAFSSDGLGIIAITDVPNLPQLRHRLLPLAQKLATLPADQLDEVTDPESGYQVGWSHGREKLEGDKPDWSKGSFYANPLTEDLVESMLDRRTYQRSNNKIIDGNMEEVLDWDESIDVVKTDDELRELAKSNPAFFAPNVWPSKHLPELESTFKDVGKLVHEVGLLVAKCCDSYVSSNVSMLTYDMLGNCWGIWNQKNMFSCASSSFSINPQKCPGYDPNKLENIIRYSKCCKARLLHYFPTAEEDNAGGDKIASNVAKDDTDFSSWCGWHNDHGSLTGLLPAMYLDSNGNIVECPDAKAGLYIKSRNGKLVHAKLPANALAFQVGETAQIHTGGLLQATPHAVRGCKGSSNVSRETFAIFMEPEYHSKMDLPVGRSLADTQCIEAEQHLPSTVRTLRSRWKMGMSFGEFSNATFAAFH